MIVLRFIHLNCIIDIIIVSRSPPPAAFRALTDLSLILCALLNLSRVFFMAFLKLESETDDEIHPVKPHNIVQHLDVIIRKPRICSEANYCGCFTK